MKLKNECGGIKMKSKLIFLLTIFLLQTSILFAQQQAQIVLSDDFTGTTIDTGKWTVVPSPNITISQNNELIFSSLQPWEKGEMAYLNSTSGFETSKEIKVEADLNLSSESSGAYISIGLYDDFGNFVRLGIQKFYPGYYKGEYRMQSNQLPPEVGEILGIAPLNTYNRISIVFNPIEKVAVYI